MPLTLGQNMGQNMGAKFGAKYGAKYGANKNQGSFNCISVTENIRITLYIYCNNVNCAKYKSDLIVASICSEVNLRLV